MIVRKDIIVQNRKKILIEIFENVYQSQFVVDLLKKNCNLALQGPYYT